VVPGWRGFVDVLLKLLRDGVRRFFHHLNISLNDFEVDIG
jgi:hypothetical protein